MYIPRPSKGIKFQPPGLFLVVKKHKFHTLGGFRFMFFKEYIFINMYSKYVFLVSIVNTRISISYICIRNHGSPLRIG